MKSQVAYIDENGNFGFKFNKQGVSSHFIITAIITDEDKKESLKNNVEKIRKQHFQTGEMKSSGVSKNDNRRLRILKDLKDLDFHILSIVVDKRKLFTDGGLKYKKSFYKFLNNLLYNELYSTFDDIEIISDEHGSQEFMNSFKRYVRNKHTPNLFQKYNFEFSKSHNNVLIQLADFICGTIGRKFQENKKTDKFKEFYKQIKNKILTIKEWPNNYEKYFVEVKEIDRNKYNRIIARISVDLVEKFIKNNRTTKDQVKKDQITFLNYLLLNLKHMQNKYISSNELIKNIRPLDNDNITKHHLRTNIVAKLRDKGLLIVSSNKGYKLPTSESDLYDFVNQSNMIIKPMLFRLKKARQKIKIATKNELDILDKNEYKDLKKYFDN